LDRFVRFDRFDRCERWEALYFILVSYVGLFQLFVSALTFQPSEFQPFHPMRSALCWVVKIDDFQQAYLNPFLFRCKLGAILDFRN